METTPPTANASEESPPEDEFERIQRIRAARQRATLFGVVGAVGVAFSIFVAVGFLLPDEQATGLWAAIAVGLTVGVALRFFLGPKEREFDPVASSPEIEVSQQDKDEWRRAMVEGAASPAVDSTADQGEDDVHEEMAEYRRRVRRLRAARVTSVIAGLVVSGVLIAIFRNVAVRNALPAFVGSIAAGTVTMVLLYQRLTRAPQRGRSGSSRPAGAEERAYLEREFGKLSACSLSYERDLIELILEYLLILPASRACKIINGSGITVASVRESGGWAARMLRAGDAFEILTATGEVVMNLEKSKGWFRSAWKLRDESGSLGRVDSRLFGSVVAVPKTGAETRFVRPWIRFAFPWTRKIRNLVRTGGEGNLVRAPRPRSAGILVPVRVEVAFPEVAGDAYSDRALLLAAAVLAS